MSDEAGRFPAGKKLAVGCTVRLCDLQSARGQELNEQVALISGERSEKDGRYAVTLINATNAQPIRIKPINMRNVCSFCHKDSATLMACGRCQVASYCNEACQATHWQASVRGHKVECKMLTFQEHPSWKRLPKSIRQRLKENHMAYGCAKTPWPITPFETHEMLEQKYPCFLTMHPKMRFIANIADVGASDNILSHSLNEPQRDIKPPYDRKVPLIKEYYDMDQKYEKYAKKVPEHMPAPVIYCIIHGRVSWSEEDYKGFLPMSGFLRRVGLTGFECVGVCPGTGETVPYSPTPKHLLVLCALCRIVDTSGGITKAYFVPRILTQEGYDRLMGPRGSQNRLVKLDGVTMELYPTALDTVFDKRFRSSSSPSAWDVFFEFQESNRFSLYSKFMEANCAKFMEAN